MPSLLRLLPPVSQVRISNTFMVEGVGEVYAGNVVSGTVSVGDRLLLGPTGPRGAFVKTAVASVHVARYKWEHRSRLMYAGNSAGSDLGDLGR